MHVETSRNRRQAGVVLGLALVLALFQTQLIFPGAATQGRKDSIVRPFQGIWPQTSAAVVFDLPALLAIVFLFLIAALVVALVRAIAGNRTV